MSEKLGQLSFEQDRPPMFLPTGQPQPPGDYSEETSREIDCEVRRIMDEQYARVRTMLSAQQTISREAAALLLTKETMSGEELKDIVARSVSQLAKESVRGMTAH